ncbi:hypothetical protein PC118_g4601 [Phytophthora cactorum]|uniref:Uncharacterized protein n=1 Tax=Phytophthora cactorum TaxID=29920 RepID=A0A8T1GI67_9STRA|nr:hypothetical protein PC118_g4601 [Phytophthora cactorum]
MIEQLKTPPLSPYLALYKDKVATIQNEDSPARSGARRKLPTSNTHLIKGDRVLRWLQPASSGLSKMEILIGWLEENYAAYLRSNQKSALINGLRDKIATAGFPRCTARELREQISSLETPPWSPFLKLYSHRLDAIFHGVRVKREPDAATNEPRAARKTHQDINETRETQRNNKVTPRDSRDDSPIKIEPCFPDGSANAPLVVYSDGDENSREFSNEPTLEEIRRREALVDARLKYSENKRTLSQDELDMLFPMPKV